MIGSHAVSENFRYAKLLAILLVATGHFFEGSLLWLPVTVGLFVFAFSSAYFTAQRYGAHRLGGAFWAAKVQRLLPALLVIDLFLLAIFIGQDRDGILSLHSLLGALGLSGLLDWLGIHNRSPFGNGLWFLTLLWAYYLVYPWLARACATPRRAVLFVAASFVACSLAHFTISPPYMFWPTVLGFCLGTAAGRQAWVPGAPAAITALVAGSVALVVCNVVMPWKAANFWLILVLSVGSCAVLLSCVLPWRPVRWLAPLTDCVLQIYLIHTYLFIQAPHWPRWAAYGVSMVVILACAWLLHSATQRLLRARAVLAGARP
ncbi:MAG: hypothetical protein QM639_17100 [Rhodocyclaceae bacterium]